MNQDAAIQELKNEMHTTQARRMFERYQAVKLVLEGRTRKETGDIIGHSAHTVGKYVADYTESGLAGLRRGISTRKPPKLTTAQRAALKEIVAYKIPADVGLTARANWTLNLVEGLYGGKNTSSSRPRFSTRNG